MMVDRRAFVAGTALLAVAPGLLPLDAAADVADGRSPVLMIDGWSMQDDGDPMGWKELRRFGLTPAAIHFAMVPDGDGVYLSGATRSRN